MTLRKLDACCSHPEHQRPYVNEDGYILTGDPYNSATWEAWDGDEWAAHCAHYTSERRRYNATRQRRLHHRKRAAA